MLLTVFVRATNFPPSPSLTATNATPECYSTANGDSGDSGDEDVRNATRTSDPSNEPVAADPSTSDMATEISGQDGRSDDAAATNPAITTTSATAAASSDCGESQPSPAVSVSSDNTDPLSEGTEDSDTAPGSAASTSSTWGEKRQQQQQQAPSVDKSTVTKIYEVRELTLVKMAGLRVACVGTDGSVTRR